MYLIERSFFQGPKITPHATGQEIVNTVALEPLKTQTRSIRNFRIGNSVGEYNLSGIWDEHTPYESSLSPYYIYSLIFQEHGPKLVITPKERYASNRYHHVLTPNGEIIGRRGKTEYYFGYGPNEYQNLAVVVGERRGRKKSPPYQLVSYMNLSKYSMSAVENPHSEPIDENLLRRFFLEATR